MRTTLLPSVSPSEPQTYLPSIIPKKRIAKSQLFLAGLTLSMPTSSPSSSVSQVPRRTLVSMVTPIWELFCPRIMLASGISKLLHNSENNSLWSFQYLKHEAIGAFTSITIIFHLSACCTIFLVKYILICFYLTFFSTLYSASSHSFSKLIIASLLFRTMLNCFSSLRPSRTERLLNLQSSQGILQQEIALNHLYPCYTAT